MNTEAMRINDAAPRYVVETEVQEVPPGYKRTQAGVIPEDWDVSAVGAEFTVQLGKMLDAAKNVGVAKPYIGNRAVQWGRIDLEELATVPMTPSDMKRFRLRRGDLLVCEGGEIGRAAIWNDPIPECYYQKALHRLRPTRGYDVVLMMSFLRLWTSADYLSNYVTQTSIAHLPKDRLEVVALPRPGAPEQRAIAEALSDVDGLLGALEALIAKKRAIKQAAMQQLLTGKTRLPGFRGEWTEEVLGSVVEALVAGVSVNSTEEEPSPGIACVLKTSALAGGAFLAHEAKRIAPRDVSRARTNPQRNTLLISRMNTPDLVGEVAYVGQDYPSLFLPDRVWMTRFRQQSKLNVRWLAYVLSSPRSRRLLKAASTGTSGSMKNIPKSALLALPIRLPAPEEQEAITAVLSDMDADIDSLEARYEKTRTIKQGIMQQLLTGRVRLVKLSPAAARA